MRLSPLNGPTADKNMNPMPSTIVNYNITHPSENDVCLAPYVAIQETARPTHYHKPMD